MNEPLHATPSTCDVPPVHTSADSPTSAALSMVAAIGKATEALFDQVFSESWEMEPALEMIGQTVDAESVYVFEMASSDRSRPVAHLFRHWHAAGMGRVPIPALPIGAPDFQPWQRELSEGNIVSGPSGAFTPEQRAHLSQLGIQSLALTPIFVNRKLWGVLGFLDFSRARRWPPAALEALKIVACVVGGLAWRREYARVLQESEERYRTLFDNNPVETIVVDNQARVVMYNRAKKSAQTRLPGIGDVMYKDYAGGHKIDLHRELLACIRDNRTKEFPELQYENRYLNIRISPLRSGAVITAIDITVYKQTQRELQESRRQLYQSQKMEALGTLVAGAAHEINNPVNLIQFNIPLFGKIWQDLLPVVKEHGRRQPGTKFGGLTCDFLDENLGQLLADVDMAANRIAKIVTDLKDFSRQSDVKDMEPISVNEAVQNAVRLAGTTLKKARVHLELDLTDDLPLNNANIHSIEQVILNITINAIQAIHHDHGRIRISTGYDSREGLTTINVEDNGKGVSQEVADRLFDPFVTDKQDEGGTGLGLSVTYSLVKAHHGDIGYANLPAGGTVFTVSLPVIDQPRRFTILIADDNKSIRELLTVALSTNEAYRIDEASNGIEACIRLGTHLPDLLILDLFMPEVDGLEVCKIIKSNPDLEGLKVLIITGFPEHPKVGAVEKLGFGDIQYKPFRMAELKKTIDRLLNT